MTTTQQWVLLAYQRGYRITDAGRLLSPSGRERSIRLYGKQRYPTFTITRGHAEVFGIPVHHFAAFCFFGVYSFQAPQVRHLNGDTLDFSRPNIALGTRSENELDKPVDMRARVARVARAAQPKTPYNAKLTDAQANEIRIAVAAGSRGTAAALARQYRVSRSAVYLIIKGRNHVC